MSEYPSWGRYPRVKNQRVIVLHWRDALPELGALDRPVLPRGLGRSYGDSCLNEGGILLDATPLRRFLAINEAAETLTCEAGTSLVDIQEQLIPRGFFLPVIPGTQFVTVGGAIANDIHGKNHHIAGTFGRNVIRFELVRSDGARRICSREDHPALFRATVGGLGLTGLITWAELRIRRVPSPFILEEKIRFEHVDAFFELSAASDLDFEYTVAWIDTTARGRRLGRGIFMRGNHADPRHHRLPRRRRPRQKTFPCDAPRLMLNPLSVKLFNAAYYHKQLRRHEERVVAHEPFFHPLDAILHWNRMYGRSGFLQYQCVVPLTDGGAAIREILARIPASGLFAFLTVLKVFGDVPSPGLLSFPRPGVTVAADFRYQGRRTLDRLARLDEVVRAAGGVLYPAKDARMAPESFAAFYPHWPEFARHIDPKFSSSFWRRVRGG
ncbi:MAG: FAD-binding oxidoreductase [Planctomycetes bacterium]|nr:FAD-binding oxidoreductase [Planctomycetota bacterium]